MILDEKVSGMGMYKLGDLCSDVVDCPHSTPEWKNEGIRVIRNFNIVNGSLDFSNGFFVDEETFEKRTQRACPEFEDLVISREAPMGAVCMIPKNLKCCLGQRLVLLKVNKDVADPNYILFAIQSQFVQKQIQIIDQTGSIVSNLNIPDLKSLRIPLPSLPEQKKIASVLSALDDKIALNKKMNQKLETMAKRLYDYWFVQYDFPDKNGHPYKTTGVPMTYNPTLKREIPAGWEVKTLKECIKHINTGLNPRDNFVLGNGDIKYVTVKNLTTEGNIDFSGCDLIDEDALKKVHKRSDIAKGDVLYASICPLGRSYLINKDPIGWDINESVFSIRPNLDVISSEFLSMFLKDSAVVEKASKMATGSIFKGIRIKELENMIFAVPAKNVMESFSKQIKNLIELEHKNIEETTRLTALRDKLLPLLMNGQVVVG